MANTTNFNWETPDDTDLVKDGALAMRTLGNAIDSSMADLRGGTSGQILAKNSNTDMDFVWIANDQGDITAVNVTSPITGGGTAGAVTIGIESASTTQSGAVQLTDSTSSTSTTTAATPNSVKSAYDLANAAIPKSLVDAAGDIIYATANDTVARLGIGTAGQVLTVNSGATAPQWSAAPSGDLVKINTTTIGTGVSSVSLNNVFSSTYDNYKIIIQWLGSSATPTMNLRVRASGTDNTGATSYQARGMSNLGGTLANFTNASSFFPLGTITNNGYDSTVIEVLNPFSASRATGFFIQHFYNSNNDYWNYGAVHYVVASYDGFTVYPSTGTITSGTITVWGYKS